jgi:hypothetical protein
VKVSYHRCTEQQVDGLLEKVIAEIDSAIHRCACYPRKVDAGPEIKESLVINIGNQGIQMVVFAPGWLWRTIRRTAVTNPNLYLQRFACMGQPAVTEALVSSLQYSCVVRNDLHGIAKRIEDASMRKLHIAK